LNTARGNFVELMLRLASTGQPIRVVEDHVASPTYAPLLAARTVDLVDRDLSGLFHIGGGMPISWFQFAKTIFEMAGLDPLLLATNEREYRTTAQRPKYSALSNARIERLGLEPIPPLRQVLGVYLAERGRKDR
jgi:dTDP-4-dehydrorhamnose reductase